MEYEVFKNFFEQLNIGQLLVIGAMFWFFYSRLDGKIDNLDLRLSAKIDAVEQRLTTKIEEIDQRLTTKIDAVEKRVFAKIEEVDQRLTTKIDEVYRQLSTRIDKLDEKMTDIDRRLCRMEGAFSSKDCCILKEERPQRKAE